jgi:hypothetical protein
LLLSRAKPASHHLIQAGSSVAWAAWRARDVSICESWRSTEAFGKISVLIAYLM